MAMKMKELLLYAKTWMNLTNIMLSKRIQAQKIIYCMVPSKLKHRQTNLCSSVKRIVILAEQEKDSDWEETKRRVASGNFYFLTSTVVTHMFTLS